MSVCVCVCACVCMLRNLTERYFDASMKCDVVQLSSAAVASWPLYRGSSHPELEDGCVYIHCVIWRYRGTKPSTHKALLDHNNNNNNGRMIIFIMESVGNAPGEGGFISLACWHVSCPCWR